VLHFQSWIVFPTARFLFARQPSCKLLHPLQEHDVPAKRIALMHAAGARRQVCPATVDVIQVQSSVVILNKNLGNFEMIFAFIN
jgi:hypothetical protein